MISDTYLLESQLKRIVCYELDSFIGQLGDETIVLTNYYPALNPPGNKIYIAVAGGSCNSQELKNFSLTIRVSYSETDALQSERTLNLAASIADHFSNLPNGNLVNEKTSLTFRSGREPAHDINLRAFVFSLFYQMH